MSNMNSGTDGIDIEQIMKRNRLPSSPSAEKERIRQDILRQCARDFNPGAADNEPVRMKHTSFLIPVLLLAACACIAVGLWFFLRNHEKNAPGEPGSGTEEVTEYETERMFLFIEVRKIDTRRYAMVQEMKGFEMLRRAKGELIHNYTITDILDDGIEVTSTEGGAEYLSSKDLRARLDKARTRELGRLQNHLAEDNLSSGGLERIGQWAKFGDETAIHLLENISDNDAHCLQAKAKDMLFGGRQARVLNKLIQTLELDNDSYRLNAIDGLSRIDSPHSRTALRRIAFGGEDRFRKAAIQGLGQLKDTACLQPLSQLINDPATEAALRAVAESVYQGLIRQSVKEK
ncbi:HEAT repeat domain-containing protein [Planctomycetota bacterium]